MLRLFHEGRKGDKEKGWNFSPMLDLEQQMDVCLNTVGPKTLKGISLLNYIKFQEVSMKLISFCHYK